MKNIGRVKDMCVNEECLQFIGLPLGGVIHGMSCIGLLHVTWESYTRLFTKENFCTEDVCSPVGQLK